MSTSLNTLNNWAAILSWTLLLYKCRENKSGGGRTYTCTYLSTVKNVAANFRLADYIKKADSQWRKKI
jgi:hypothetical protein